jgi:hypothetical protein
VRGIDSSVSVMVSPSFASLPPQHGQAVGLGSTTRSRGRCEGSGARTGLLRVNGRTFVVSGGVGAASAASSAAAVSSSSSCISSWPPDYDPGVAAALGRSAEAIALQPGDQRLEMRDHRLGPRGARLEFSTRAALGQQRRLQRVDVVRDAVADRAHAEYRITHRRRRAREFFGK